MVLAKMINISEGNETTHKQLVDVMADAAMGNVTFVSLSSVEFVRDITSR